MVRHAAILVVLAGCDVVFGLSSVAPVDATDAPPSLIVTGTLRQMYVTNDASFAATTGERIYSPGTIAFAVTLDDDTDSPVTYNADGTFSFAIARPGQSYRFTYTVDSVKSELQQNAPVLDVANGMAGRPDALPTQATVVQFPYPMSTGANFGAYVLSTGLYTQTATNQYGPTVSFDWRLAAPATSGVLGLLEMAKHDQIFAAEFVNDTTTTPLTYMTIDAVSKTSITQSPNATITIPGPQPVARNTCARFSAPNAAESARLMAASSRSYFSTSYDWLAFMVPAASTMANTGALWVANSNGSPARDLDLAPTFHDPFTGMTLVIESAATANFRVQLPGGTPLNFANINRRYVVAERGTPGSCTQAKALLPPQTGLPMNISLDGTPLDTDGKLIALDLTHSVPLTWTVTPGPIDYFVIAVHELQVVNGMTTNFVRATIGVAGQTSARLDPTLFVPGKKYQIAITSAIARPNAAEGDWATVRFPIENATMWSFYFQAEAR